MYTFLTNYNTFWERFLLNAMKKRKKWIVTAVILVVFCAVLGVYRHFGPGSSASDADPAAVSAPRKKSVLNVNGLVVRPQSLADGITMVGNLLPDEELSLIHI